MKQKDQIIATIIPTVRNIMQLLSVSVITTCFSENLLNGVFMYMIVCLRVKKNLNNSEK